MTPDREMHQALVHYTTDGIVVLDESLRVIYMNPAAQRMTGWRAEDAAGLLCGQILGCPYALTGECQGREAFASLEPVPHVELQLKGRTGMTRYVSSSLATLPSLHGEPRRLVMILREITEQKALDEEQKAAARRMVDALKRQKRQSDILYRIGHEMVSVLDLEQNLHLLVDETRNLMRTDLVVLMLLDPEGRELSVRAWSGSLVDEARSLSMRQNAGFIWSMIASGKGGKTENFPEDLEPPPEKHPLMFLEKLKSAIGQPLMRRGRPFGALVAANRRPHTFTEEDAALLASVANTAALALENRRLYARLEEAAQQAERQRLAAEIHDGLTQSLYGLSLLLENLEDAVPSLPPAEVCKSLRRARRVVAESLADTRQIIFDLRASAFRDGADLVSLVRDALQYFRHETGMEANLLLPGETVPELSQAETSQLFRILQEALVNVRKHARATRVTVAIRQQEELLVMAITDDGRGFDPQTAENSAHFGLRIMGERAQTLGGWCAVESTPGAGTRITVSVPLRKAAPVD
ncbi:MAG TPA: GAF domain-containing protein [Symbiobacteriaceae bacterium]|nr:GAF domain-containing protein [Symbiobacteriaceae bacterium]